jgi:hypothetical protein
VETEVEVDKAVVQQLHATSCQGTILGEYVESDYRVGYGSFKIVFDRTAMWRSQLSHFDEFGSSHSPPPHP